MEADRRANLANLSGTSRRVRIAINAQWLHEAMPTGIGTVTAGILSHLFRSTSSHDYHLFSAGAPSEWARGGLTMHGSPGPKTNKYWRLIWENSALPLAIRRIEPDVFFSTNYSLPVGLKKEMPRVAYVYDLIWMRFPQFFPELSRLMARHRFAYTCRHASWLIVDSVHTGQDIQEFFRYPASRILVAHAAADERRFHPGMRDQPESLQAIRQKYQLPASYCFGLADLRPHKNLLGLCRGFAVAKARYKFNDDLVLAGLNIQEWGSLQRLLGRPVDGIRWMGRIPDDDLPWLYAGATCFAFPSLYEGFGLPVLEAMACGTPVICSRVASLPEVAGGAALMVDPTNQDELVAALGRVLGNHMVREKMREKGLNQAKNFSWQESVRRILDLLENLRG